MDNQNKLVRIGYRIPHWAMQNTMLFQGLVRYNRENQQSWKIESDIYTENELPQTVIDEHWEGDGLIVFRCTEQEAKAWREKNIPVVNISAETEVEGIPNIVADNYLMGKIAAEHLMSLGLQHFAYVGERFRKYSQLRLAGFRDTIKASGKEVIEIDLPISTMEDESKSEEIHKQLNAAMKDLPLPTGILARDDVVALNVLKSARHLNMSVPDEIAVLGVNNSMPYCFIAHPNLTSVQHPAQLIGYHAAKALDMLMKGEEVEEHTMVKPLGVAVRESTNMIAVNDALVSDVLKEIRTKIPKGPVMISELARKFGVSHTNLRNRFKKSLGLSIKHEVDRARLAEVKRRLVETDDSLQEIAYSMKFLSPEEFSRFFSRNAGLSPSLYRSVARKGL